MPAPFLYVNKAFITSWESYDQYTLYIHAYERITVQKMNITAHILHKRCKIYTFEWKSAKTDTIRKTKNRELFGCLRDNVKETYISQVPIWQTFSETVIKTDVITTTCANNKKKILYLVPLPNSAR